MYTGDIRLGETLDIKFCTVNTSGVPTTLAGSPVVSAYVGNGTTEITAGITLTVDFDARTGLNNVRVVASSGNGFATDTNVQLVITTGTVSGASVVGYVVGTFSIEARSAVMPTTATRTLTIESDGMAHADVKEWLGVAPLALSSQRVQSVDTNSANLDAAISTRATPTNITAGTITTVTNLTNLPAITANWLTAAGIAAAALNGKGDWNIGKTGYALSAAGVQAVWDALTSALTTVGSIGKLLVDNINATISSRSSHTAADVWAVATRILTAGTNIVLAKGVGVTGFNDLSAAQVNAEVVDALNVDTYAEPAQGAPPATATLQQKLSYLYKAWRNRTTQTASQYSLYADNATTIDHKATFADDTVTADRSEVASGP